MEHKKQHTIPKCYLKAWCDPSYPKGQTPYIWIFSKDGLSSKRKSPDKSFIEKDFYTISDEKGNRNLSLEHGLSELESNFISIRRKVIDKRKNISMDDKFILAAFTEAMKSRTKAFAIHQSMQWQKIIDKADQMKEWAKTASVEQKRIASRIEKGTGPSFSYEEVKKIAKNPIKVLLAPSVNTVTPLLMKMNLSVLEAEDGANFITSDNPCVWMDPEAYKRHPVYRSPGLIYDSIEVILPVSPKHVLIFHRKDADEYIPTDAALVEKTNRIIRHYCHQQFIVNGNYIKKTWFE